MMEMACVMVIACVVVRLRAIISGYLCPNSVRAVSGVCYTGDWESEIRSYGNTVIVYGRVGECVLPLLQASLLTAHASNFAG